MAKTTPPANSNGANGASPINTTENNSAEFAIQRIYTGGISLETPHSPHIFQEQWQPSVDVQLNASTHKLAENTYQVKMSLTVTTQVKEKVAFLVEVQQAGIFTISNLPADQLNRMLGSYCPNILFPFAREVVADIVGRAGFPPLYLAPINFDALYEQQLAQQNAPTSQPSSIEA